MKKGDKVRPLDETGEGIVLKVQDGNVLVRMNDGFDRVFRDSRLVVVETAPEEPAPVQSVVENEIPFDPEEALRLKEEFFAKRNSSKPALKHVPEKLQLEVDLHIEELVEDLRGLDSGMKMKIQMDHFRIKMEEAIAGRYRKVIIIHGVGNGVLKAAIRKALQEEYGLQYTDAPLSRYGFGATAVELQA